MKIEFIYPGLGANDALSIWAETIIRHTKTHKVFLERERAGDADFYLFLTEKTAYPRVEIDRDIESCIRDGVFFGVLHNQHNPPVPSPGHYPSFVWTEHAYRDLTRINEETKLARSPYEPVFLAPMPCFVPVVPYKKKPFKVVTFGQVEPKKKVWQMFDRVRELGVAFWAYTPENLVAANLRYIEGLRADGCEVFIHPWQPEVESLAPLFEDASHFLFHALPTKAGSGGSPTSPRYATFFNRPVLVVDDEATMERDGFTVLGSLSELTLEKLESLSILGAPSWPSWTPHRYLNYIVERVLEFWGKK